MSKHGKIVNQVSGLEIPGVQTRDGFTNSFFWFTMDNDDDRERSFDRGSWYFVEDKPSALEQFKALDLGQRFTIDGDDSLIRVKVGDTKYILIGDTGYVDTHDIGIWGQDMNIEAFNA